MKITFPYMGYSWVAIRSFIEGIGHEAIVPPKPSKRTLDYATKYSPEFACIPFKILLGSYIEALEMGADTIISTGGIGPCRAGYYTQLQNKILKSIGYDFEMITIEPPKNHIPELLHIVRRLVNVPLNRAISAAKLAWTKLKVIDDLEILCHEIRPLERAQGTVTKLMESAVKAIDETNDIEEIKEIAKDYGEKMRSIDADWDKNPVKVGIIGEIYVVLEPFANYNVIELLNNMGVYAHRSIFLTNWTRENAFLDALRIAPEKNIRMKARPYLNIPVGGHGENSVGETVLYAERGYDGVIQLAPFTCIPEIVAKSIIPRVSRELDIPVLTLTLDEQTGVEGVRTRLEAFIDLLERRREKRLGRAV